MLILLYAPKCEKWQVFFFFFFKFLSRHSKTGPIIIMTTLGETVEVSRVRYDCVILTCKKA